MIGGIEQLSTSTPASSPKSKQMEQYEEKVASSTSKKPLVVREKICQDKDRTEHYKSVYSYDGTDW